MQSIGIVLHMRILKGKPSRLAVRPSIEACPPAECMGAFQVLGEATEGDCPINWYDLVHMLSPCSSTKYTICEGGSQGGSWAGACRMGAWHYVWCPYVA